MTTFPPIPPNAIWVIVKAEEMEEAASLMLLVRDIPRFLRELNDVCTAPLIPGTRDGTDLAREIFDVSVESRAGTMLCLSALWICLYAPTPERITMNQLRTMAGHGIVKIDVSRDRQTWETKILNSREDLSRHNANLN